MIQRPALHKVFLISIIFLLPCFLALNLAWAKSPTRVPLVIEGMSISASSITDPQGNVVGVTIPLKRAGRLVLLEGIIGHVVGCFILDTRPSLPEASITGAGRITGWTSVRGPGGFPSARSPGSIRINLSLTTSGSRTLPTTSGKTMNSEPEIQCSG